MASLTVPRCWSHAQASKGVLFVFGRRSKGFPVFRTESEGQTRLDVRHGFEGRSPPASHRPHRRHYDLARTLAALPSPVP